MKQLTTTQFDAIQRIISTANSPKEALDNIRIALYSSMKRDDTTALQNDIIVQMQAYLKRASYFIETYNLPENTPKDAIPRVFLSRKLSSTANYKACGIAGFSQALEALVATGRIEAVSTRPASYRLTSAPLHPTSFDEIAL